MNIIDIARTAHEVNRTYCQSIGDNSQPTWDEAPEWQKNSVIDGVKFYLENLDATPEDSHKSWLKFKEEDGWVYGKIKDADKKTHPCMVPYSELPAEQQTKDHLFLTVCREFRTTLQYEHGHADMQYAALCKVAYVVVYGDEQR